MLSSYGVVVLLSIAAAGTYRATAQRLWLLLPVIQASGAPLYMAPELSTAHALMRLLICTAVAAAAAAAAAASNYIATGTPLYMSRELFDGTCLDEAADVYCCCCCHICATGTANYMVPELSNGMRVDAAADV
jgi:hypothetical protein